PAADRRQADDEAAEEPDQHSGAAVAVREAERVVRDLPRTDEALGQETRAPEDERAAEHLRRDRVDVVAVAVLEPGREPDAEQRRGRAAEEHPPRQLRLHVAEPTVAQRADRLEDRAV